MGGKGMQPFYTQSVTFTIRAQVHGEISGHFGSSEEIAMAAEARLL